MAGDDEIDERYHQIERPAIELVARQQPVASDLRRLVALVQTSLHLERIGDMAEAAHAAKSLPAIPAVLE